MTEFTKVLPLQGYILLPCSPIPRYRGVDRDPFEPALIESEIDGKLEFQEGLEPPIWAFYPPGWRREAYKIFEENMVNTFKDDLFLLNSFEAAQKIQELIEPHLGSHEIVKCEIFPLECSPTLQRLNDANFLGYDLAYAGGDYYSAVLNGIGLHHNSHYRLLEKYRPSLNKFGLFDHPELALQYIEDFRKASQSETNSEFYLFTLTAIS